MDHSHYSRKRIRGVLPELQERARELRAEMTEAEGVLWKELRRKKLGVRFRRQHAVGRMILDFYCPRLKLVIEVDGGIHRQRREQDRIRTEQLEAYGYYVIRFNNGEILRDCSSVIKEIHRVIKRREELFDS